MARVDGVVNFIILNGSSPMTTYFFDQILIDVPMEMVISVPPESIEIHTHVEPLFSYQ